MKFQDLTPKNVAYMVECIETILKRLCIDTKVTMVAKTNRNGEEYVHVESSDIVTTPAMFKKINIEGNGYITHDEEHPKCYDLEIPLGYRYTHFHGGYNGVGIGTVMFRIINDGYIDVRFKGMLLTAYVEEEE